MNYVGKILSLIKREKYYVASDHSKDRLYHFLKSDCPYIRHILVKNKKLFQTSEEAERNGYIPCRICHAFLTQKRIIDFK